MKQLINKSLTKLNKFCDFVGDIFTTKEDVVSEFATVAQKSFPASSMCG